MTAAKEKALQNRVACAFCVASGESSMDRETLRTLVSFAKQHGWKNVKEWIALSALRLDPETTTDEARGRYISGIRRRWLEEQTKKVEAAQSERRNGSNSKLIDRRGEALES